MHRLYYPQSNADHEESLHFHKYIRNYNSAFAFTSFGGKIDHGINQAGRGPYIFKVNGEVYHQHGSLIPDDNTNLQYAQLYFFDAAEALN